MKVIIFFKKYLFSLIAIRYHLRFILLVCFFSIFFFETFLIAAQESERINTYLSPIINVELETNRNIIFSASFKLAWDKLKDSIINEEIVLYEQPFLAKQLNIPFSYNDCISENDYIAMAGFGKDLIIEKINEELRQKFGNQIIQLDYKVKPFDIFSFGFIRKNMIFKQIFDILASPVNFGNESVLAFGFEKYTEQRNKSIEEQIKILYYKDENDFVIEIKTTSENDNLILAKVLPKKTLEYTLQYILNKIEEGWGESLQKGDILAIPIIKCDYKENYNSLENKRILNIGFTQYKIASAMHHVMFNLDEKGLFIQSRAEIKILGTFKRRHSLIFDKPFMIFLKRKDSSRPYFIMWVGNSDSLIKKEM